MNKKFTTPSEIYFTTPTNTGVSTPTNTSDSTPTNMGASDNIKRAYIVLIFNFNNTKKNNGKFLVEPAVVRVLGHGKNDNVVFEKKAVAAM